MYIYSCLYELLYVTICIFIKLHEFLLIFPTVIHYHMGHSSLFLLLVCNLSLKQCQTWISTPTIHLVNYLIQICVCFSVRVNNLYPYKTTLSARGQYFYIVLLPSVLQTLFISRVLRPAPFPSPSIEAVPYICNIVRLSF